MLKTIAIIVVVAIVAVLIYAALRPATFQVQRSIAIKAPPEKILAHLEDFKQWRDWSPYEKYDPDMQRSYGGSPSGKGATYEWSGNSKVGAGHMEILEVSPARVSIKLDFIKPFEGHNVATFSLVPQGELTNVTWMMDGPSPYIARLMGLVFNMDRMIGGDFETGLQNLKAVSEK